MRVETETSFPSGAWGWADSGSPLRLGHEICISDAASEQHPPVCGVATAPVDRCAVQMACESLCAWWLVATSVVALTTRCAAAIANPCDTRVPRTIAPAAKCICLDEQSYGPEEQSDDAEDQPRVRSGAITRPSRSHHAAITRPSRGHHAAMCRAIAPTGVRIPCTLVPSPL